MAISMNTNWLSFSLSPSSQSLSAAVVPHLISADRHEDDDNGPACFAALSSSTASPDPPMLSSFPFLEAFDASTHHHSQQITQNWFFGGGSSSSELSMLVGSSKRSRNEEDEQQLQPKLEDFLGGNGFISELHPSSFTNTATSSSAARGGTLVNDSSSSCDNNGVSTIDAWLRNSRSVVLQSSSSASLPTEAAEEHKIESVGGGRGQLDSQAITGAADHQAAPPPPPRGSFGQRTSIYRGVTRHRWTGRYEAHLWDNSVKREGQTRKGRQVYLGGYDKEDKAARAYDLAALKYWGPTTITNFPIGNYEKDLEEMHHMTRQEFIASLRRKSSGFSRGASIYRGVTRHHQHGRWQARIGRVAGNKDLYLGTFSTQEEAAEAYDIAAIRFRGLNAVTNFDMNRYDVKRILESDALPVGAAAAKRLKDAADQSSTTAAAGLDFGRRRTDEDGYLFSQLCGAGGGSLHHGGWPPPAAGFHHPRQYPYGLTADQLHLWPSSSSVFNGDFVAGDEGTGMMGYARMLQSSSDSYYLSSMAARSGERFDVVGGGHADAAPFLTVWNDA